MMIDEKLAYMDRLIALERGHYHVTRELDEVITSIREDLFGKTEEVDAEC